MGTIAYDKRIRIIKKMLQEDATQQEIADKIGCHRNTIVKDFRRWRQTEDYLDWLHEQQLRLYGVIKEKDPITAFKEVNKLIAKSMVVKVEQKTEIEGEIKLKHDLTPLLDEFARLFPRTSGKLKENTERDDSGESVDKTSESNT